MKKALLLFGALILCLNILPQRIGVGVGTNIGTANSAPYAHTLSITGETYMDSTLTGAYYYSDGEGDAENVSTFKWYRYPQGGSLTNTDSTRQSYVLSEDDLTYYIQFEVIPHAVSGATPGDAVTTNTGPVLAWAIRTKAGGYIRTKSNELIKTR